MTVNYTFHKTDLTAYLIHLLKRNKTIRVTLMIFNLLAGAAASLILLGVITKWLWCFILGISFIGLNAYRPNIKKEAIKKLNELAQENKLKDCFGLITLTVEKDGLILKNENGEERIPGDKLTNVQMDDKYLTLAFSHGQLFIPTNKLPANEDKLRLFNALEKIRSSAKV